MINPFWVVLHSATGRMLNCSAVLDTTKPILLVDGWLEDNTNLFDKLTRGVLTDPSGDAAVLAHNPQTFFTLALRDRFGVHSIYYAKDAENLHISSSISGLKHSGLRLRPDQAKNCIFVASHYRYFTFPKNSTFFTGVSCLMPGEYLMVATGIIKTGSFTDLELADMSRQSEQEISEEFLHRLNRSVRARLALVKRPAFTLSSGMDSSTVACLASRVIGPPTLITTTFDDPTEYDESSEVSKTAQAIGGEWLQMKISQDELSIMLSKSESGSDEPCATITQMMHRVVAERARDLGHDALFSGLGGDEASCGEIEEYLYYFADLRYLGMEERLLRDLVGWAKYHGTAEFPKNLTILENFFLSEIDFTVPGRVLLNNSRFYSNFDALSEDMTRADIPCPQLPNPFTSYLLNKLYQDLFFETIPIVLKAETHNARLTGVPTLYPFLERGVMMHGFSTPLTMRYKDGTTKPIIRAATKGIVPDTARNNFYKRGWNAPVDKWLRHQLTGIVEDLLNDRQLQQRGVYNISVIRRKLNEHLSGQKNHMQLFWQFINYERWYRAATE